MTDPTRPTPPPPAAPVPAAWMETSAGYQGRVGDGQQSCTRDEPCFQALAEGWITVIDLCGPCTQKLMASLDREHGTPLAWHQFYVDRAKEGQQP